MATRRIARRTDEQTDGFESARRRLLSLAYRMLGSRAEAEDIVQEAWLRWRTAPHEALHTPAAWLTTVTVRLAIDRIRALEREREYWEAPIIREPWADSHAPSAESIVADAALLTDGLMRMYAHLSTEERAALLLFEAFDCNYDEIARVLSRRVDACRQLVRRAKLRLRSVDALAAPVTRIAHVDRGSSHARRALDSRLPDVPMAAGIPLPSRAIGFSAPPSSAQTQTTGSPAADSHIERVPTSRAPASRSPLTPIDDRESQPTIDVIERIHAAIANQDKRALISLMLDEVSVVTVDMNATEVDVAAGIAEAGRTSISAVATTEVDRSPTTVRATVDAECITTSPTAQFNGALTAKTGSFEIASKRVSAEDLARTWTDWIAKNSRVEAIALEGRPGLAFLDGCQIVMAIGFVLRANRIACCLMMDESTLRVLNDAYDPMRVLSRVMTIAAPRIAFDPVLA